MRVCAKAFPGLCARASLKPGLLGLRGHVRDTFPGVRARASLKLGQRHDNLLDWQVPFPGEAATSPPCRVRGAGGVERSHSLKLNNMLYLLYIMQKDGGRR
jgi:hypothetical protein